MADPEIRIFKDRIALSEAAAELFIQLAESAGDRFTVSLSGGSTPKELYRLLASDKYSNRVDWNKVIFIIGDERNVSPDSPESNYRIASETLFNPLSIPREQILSWNTEHHDPQSVAHEFEIGLINFATGIQSPAALPRLDLVLLGLGADAHTASLFPNTEALKETKHLAVANWVEKLNTWRYTLTFPLINNAANVVFLAAGDDKAEAVQLVIDGERDPVRYPAQSVNPGNGRLIWLLDTTAGSRLNDLYS